VALFQCACGARVEMEPRFGDEITSVSHLHRSARLDGTALIVRMEEVRVPDAADPAPPAKSTPGRLGRRTARGVSSGHTAVSGGPEPALMGGAS